MVLKDVSNILQYLVHVLVVMILERFESLLGFAFFKVLHLKLVVSKEFEMVLNLNVALFARFYEFVQTIWLNLGISVWTLGTGWVLKGV
jgi:hypothetical protein